MARRPVPVHYLRPNEREWSPPCIAVLDTETRVVQRDPEVQEIRCWHARIADRRQQGTHEPGQLQAEGITAAEAAAAIHAWTRGRDTVWLACHNLSFDLAVTRLPILLADMGWTISDFAIDSRSPWLKMMRGHHSLTIIDSYSWLPAKLQKIGVAVGIDKPADPPEDDDAGWLERCKADTDITLRAMLTLLDYWDDNHLGNWSVSGAACGWNAYRHLNSTWRVLIGEPCRWRGREGHLAADDKGSCEPCRTAALEFDQRAIYGGRRGIWRAGKMPPGRYVEADFERAYTVVARDLPLPVRRERWFSSLPIDTPLLRSRSLGIVAEVELETDVPRWPVRVAGKVRYPVGRFVTTLAGPDIAAAAELGCLRRIGRGQVHHLGFAMRQWATWCLDAQAARDADVPPAVKIMMKNWGRAVVGKWAQRGFVRRRIGMATTYGWSYEPAYDNDTKSTGHIIDIAGGKFLSYQDGYGDNAYPAVLAYVEAYVRTRLARVIDAVGDDIILQCDTDGLILNVGALERGPWRGDLDYLGEYPEQGRVEVAMAILSGISHPLTLREKSVFRRLEMIGPQHMRMDEQQRFAGVPPGAVDDGDGRLAAWTWPKLAWQMGNGDRRGYVRVVQRYVISPHYAPGWVTADGYVLPVELRIGAAGQTEMVAWPSTRYAAAGRQLAEHQDPELRRWAGASCPEVRTESEPP